MPKMRTDDGVELNYRIDDFRDPWITEPGDTIVLSHGIARSMKWWLQCTPALARKYTVLRYDIRGCGESSVPPEDATWSEERLARDVLNLIDHLGIEKVHWAGFESGGLWGMQFASTYTDRIKSLILCNVPLFIENIPGVQTAPEWQRTDGPKKRNLNIGSDALEKVGLRQWLMDTNWTRFDLATVDPKLLEWHLNEHSKTPVTVFQSIRMIAEDLDLAGALPKIKVPTLIMAGDRSPVTPLTGQVYMQSQIPNSRLMVFPNIGSSMHLLIPERVVKVMLEFLEEVAG